MATAFRIHEDIENNVMDGVPITTTTNNNNNSNNNGKRDTKKSGAVGFKKNHNTDKDASKQQQQRSTFAILNNIGYESRANVAVNAQKTALNVFQSVKVSAAALKHTNDENDVPQQYTVKGGAVEAKVPVDQFKAFGVFEPNPEVKQQQQLSDENRPPSTHESNDDEVDCAIVAANSSFVGLRQPLQEIKQDETPMCVREILSPMSIDKSLIDNKEACKAMVSAGPATNAHFPAKVDTEKFFEVEEYREDILEYLREAEIRHRPKPMYMRKQPDISHSMRTILVDWLVEVGEEYRLQTETLCLAVSYIDRFLSVMSVVRAKLQLVGTAAMFIAAKYEEIYPPDVSEFVYITDNTYTKKQVLRMEQLILKVLTFDLCVPTTSIFLNAYPMMEDDLSKEVKFMAQYLCELSLLEAEPYLQYTPSMISAAAIALSRINFNHTIWTVQLERFTGYKIPKLTELILHLSATHCSAITSQQQAIQDKYKGIKYSEVSARTPIRIDEITLSNAIQELDYLDADVDVERNENVRKMISSLLFD